jgi:hypothetical protein
MKSWAFIFTVKWRPEVQAQNILQGRKCSSISNCKDSAILTIHCIDFFFLQDYTITMYLNQYWKGERLAFSTDDEILTLSGDFAEKIWVPDTFFANDKNR